MVLPLSPFKTPQAPVTQPHTRRYDDRKPKSLDQSCKIQRLSYNNILDREGFVEVLNMFKIQCQPKINRRSLTPILTYCTLFGPFWHCTSIRDNLYESQSNCYLMPRSHFGNRAYDCRQFKVPGQATIHPAMLLQIQILRLHLLTKETIVTNHKHYLRITRINKDLLWSIFFNHRHSLSFVINCHHSQPPAAIITFPSKISIVHGQS